RDRASLHTQRPSRKADNCITNNRQDSVLDCASNERNVPTRFNIDRVRCTDGEDWVRVGEEIDQHDRDDVVWDAADEGHDQRREVVYPAVSKRSHHRPNRDSDYEAKDQRNTDGEDGPGERFRDDTPDRDAWAGDRCSELPPGCMPEVLRVLSQEGSVR